LAKVLAVAVRPEHGGRRLVGQDLELLLAPAELLDVVPGRQFGGQLVGDVVGEPDDRADAGVGQPVDHRRLDPQRAAVRVEHLEAGRLAVLRVDEDVREEGHDGLVVGRGDGFQALLADHLGRRAPEDGLHLAFRPAGGAQGVEVRQGHGDGRELEPGLELDPFVDAVRRAAVPPSHDDAEVVMAGQVEQDVLAPPEPGGVAGPVADAHGHPGMGDGVLPAPGEVDPVPRVDVQDAARPHVADRCVEAGQGLQPGRDGKDVGLPVVHGDLAPAQQLAQGGPRPGAAGRPRQRIGGRVVPGESHAALVGRSAAGWSLVAGSARRPGRRRQR
jgi:hypothetical protein